MLNIQALAEAYFSQPSAASREAVVMASVPLVRSIVKRLHAPGHPCLDFEDLQGVGLLGLIEALDRYDPDRGVRFASFAYSRVRGAIVDYIRLIDVLPRERRRSLSEARRAYDVLCQEQGQAPGEQDVADFLGISVEQYAGLLQDAQQRNVVSLHAPLNGHSQTNISEEVASDDALDAFEQVEREWSCDRLRGIIARLPDREQLIVRYYYFDNMTQREIGTALNVSEARVSQVLSRVLRKLRDALTEHAMAA